MHGQAHRTATKNIKDYLIENIDLHILYNEFLSQKETEASSSMHVF